MELIIISYMYLYVDILGRQRVAFYGIRFVLALFCALSEVFFYRQISLFVSPHVAHLMLFFLLGSAGMAFASSGWSFGSLSN